MAHIDFEKRLDRYMQERRIPLVKRRPEDVVALDDKGLPLVKEPEGDVELPEDLGDQRYNCDRATIQAFVRKYLKEGAVLPKRMLKECLTDLFEPPYRWTGLIFDNFPASSYDADAALSNFAVPEIVVELVCSPDEARSRTTSKLYKAWKMKQDERKANEKVRFENEMEKVTKLREKWVLKMLKARRKLRRNRLLIDPGNGQDDESGDSREIEEQVSTSDADIDSTDDPYDSSDSSDSEVDKTQAEIDRAEFQEKSHARYKDPVKFEDWEHPATVRERIRREVDEDYEFSSQKLAAAKSVFEEESIPWIEVDAEQSQAEVLMTVLKILDPYVFRNASFLERVEEVDVETAEKLLDSGYYFLSSFGKFCPVQMFENKIPFQMFLPLEAAHQIYPVLHRQYIYFLAGKERLTAFIEHPLKYLNQDSCTPLIPARIAVIGPPKCGKTTIANRFARTYGMKAITRGQVLRHTLKNFSWTELATLTSAHLRGGHTALDESIARCVELDSIDPRGISQGYILDGFPENQSEAEELAFLGIQPMIVVDLKADLDFCLRCLAADSNARTKPPTFSPCYLSHQYEEWQAGAADYRCWLKKFSQNVVTLDATAQKLAVWIRADREVCRRFSSIKKYFREADYDTAHSLTHLCVSLYEFRERQSRYESYCPVCLGRDNVLTFSGTPPNHEGMVQFRSHYYWVCDIHLAAFLANASAILSSIQDVVLPQSRPEIVDEEIDVNHACWAKRLKVSGFCPVTYLDSLPDRRVFPGLNTLGVVFKEDLYLFCSTECRGKFITQPTKYADVQINFTRTFPPININALPNLGFLEQTVAGRVPVPDARFDYLCEYFKPPSKVPGFLNVVDIAGLVKGAAEGQGLGNAFLSHISACDAIFHLCRAFEDDDVTHIEGEVNPVRDLEIISEELRLKDVEFLNAHLEKLEKLVVRGNDKKLKPEYDTLLKVKSILVDEKKHIRFADWSANDIEVLNKYLFLTSKPVIYLVNLSEKDYIRKKNKWLIKIKEWVDKNDPGSALIPFSGVFENKIFDMEDEERAKYFEEHKATSALDKIIVQGYKALQLQYFFTAGHDEVKAWTIPKGAKAPQAAGRIHTDFEKGFIMAEVMKFDDFKNEGSEAAVKAAGKYRQQGRNYVVEDGDIIFFKFNAGAGLKDAKKK
ncbi:adenylate kinase 9 isoform X2 [Neodiprion virginianus]|uniref:adenylate kinase 9 isoform X2 n=1 Tax=Neodiprion virginianus TaxID=2961670 RepID=UPI001EE6A9EA|nr:adenylate kinase 9 isoform X2 [Neodiprion virginianus]